MSGNRKLYHVRFKVRGSYRFPLDMLRHDQCYPVHPDDGAAIEFSFGTRNPEGYAVELGMYTRSPHLYPTKARWASFGWYVDEDSIFQDEVAS